MLEEQKQFLNMILYEKRMTTYIVCVIMILIGVGLGFYNTDDSVVLNAYKAKYYSDITFNTTKDYTSNIEITNIQKKNGGFTFDIINKNSVPVYSVYSGDELLFSGKLEPNKKVVGKYDVATLPNVVVTGVGIDE